MTYQECVTYLASQKNVPDEIWNAEDAHLAAVEYVSTLTEYPKTEKELQDNYADYLAAELGL